MDDPTPSYDGAKLANLAAELEIRLTGRSPTRGLRPELAELIPHTRNYLLLIIDGLGDQQLAHPAAATLRRHRRAALIAPFPTTTSVGLSSVTTALAPMQHGVIGYTQWMPTLRTVVNMLEWVDMTTGQPINLDPVDFHPSPNLPERLSAAGVRTVIFQPAELLDTPVSKMLCRGAERHGYSSPLDIQPSDLFGAGHRTLAVVYTTAVDTAAHASGQRSQAYSMALSATSQVWEHLRRSLPPDTTLIGSADHGHCDIPADGRIHLDESLTDGVQWWGDGRVLMFSGPLEQVHRIARRTGAQFVSAEQLRRWLGGGPPHPALNEFPTAALLAPPGTVILPQHLLSPNVGHHGGNTPQELLIPLLVAWTGAGIPSAWPLAGRQRHPQELPDDHRNRDEPLVLTLRQPHVAPFWGNDNHPVQSSSTPEPPERPAALKATTCPSARQRCPLLDRRRLRNLPRTRPPAVIAEAQFAGFPARRTRNR